MVSSVVVTIEGVNLSEGYIVRELSIYYVGTKSTRHHHFNPPTNFHLNEDNRKTDAYTRKKLGGLGVFTVIPGGKPYEESAAIVTELGAYKIICAGEITRKWLRTILPHGNIVDIQETTKFVYPKELVSTWCGYFHANFRYCSYGKLLTLVYFLKFSGEIVY